MWLLSATWWIANRATKPTPSRQARRASGSRIFAALAGRHPPGASYSANLSWQLCPRGSSIIFCINILCICLHYERRLGRWEQQADQGAGKRRRARAGSRRCGSAAVARSTRRGATAGLAQAVEGAVLRDVARRQGTRTGAGCYACRLHGCHHGTLLEHFLSQAFWGVGACLRHMLALSKCFPTAQLSITCACGPRGVPATTRMPAATNNKQRSLAAAQAEVAERLAAIVDALQTEARRLAHFWRRRRHLLRNDWPVLALSRPGRTAGCAAIRGDIFYYHAVRFFASSGVLGLSRAVQCLAPAASGATSS